MTGRRRGLAAGTALAALLLVAACDGGATGGAGDEGRASPAPAGPTATAPPPGEPATTGAEPRTVDEEQAHATVLAMDDALQAGDVEAFLAHVAGDLQEEQRAWFQGVTGAPLDVHELRLDGVVSQRGCITDGATCTDGGTVAHVGLRHQLTGADPVPVLEQYRWVLGDLGDGAPVLVDSRGRDGDHHGHPQLWDLGEELAVLEGHSVTVLAQSARVSEAETLLATLDRAAELTLAELPWVAQGQDRLTVQLVPAETLEEQGWFGTTGSALWLHVSPDELPREPGRLTSAGAPVQDRLFLDLDLALADLEDYGLSPGGQTELRYIAAYAATWGEDPGAWPEDWILEGPAHWWAAADDPGYADNLRLVMGDHFALAGPPVGLPLSPPDQEDPEAYDTFALESFAVAFYIEETYGRAALVDLVGLLIPLDQRHQRERIEEAYLETLGVGPQELVAGYAAWVGGLPSLEDEPGPPPQGR